MPIRSVDGDAELRFTHDGETLVVTPWGPNAFRVRATKLASFPAAADNWALLTPAPAIPSSYSTPSATVNPSDKTNAATLTNGAIRATITARGKLTMTHARSGRVLLEEFSRNRVDGLDPHASALEILARDFRPIPGTDYFRLTARFESPDRAEKIYGMGQYQQAVLDLKGADLELAQRNSQASVPFAVSSRGYGFLWNNPAVGRAVFGTNATTFEAHSTQTLDYWIVAGDTPAEMVEAYSRATGTVPMMPEYGLGFWQCKLRYQTQDELLAVAREYRSRKVPLDVIVVDFFHWFKQGLWAFDPTFWPDPDAMMAELKDMGVELMVSIWPTVDKSCANYDEMLERGLLVRTERGVRVAMEYMGNTVHFDATNPEARAYVWEKVRENYYSKGVRVFWLDEAEPEYVVYDYDNYRYHAGPTLAVGNIYPRDYAQGFYEGMTGAGQAQVVNLIRCAWAGTQRFGGLVWSGDIASSWPVFRSQICAGLQMGLAGIPWWTTDIGGFHGGDPRDPAFRELFVRWFQWGAFCPVMRLHGSREPQQPQHGTTGGSACRSGAPNEIWSYGEEVYEICKQYILLREQMRGYVRGLMHEASEKGTPVIRALFYEFPADDQSWDEAVVTKEYMFGGRYLVCPVLEPGVKSMRVYLPPARWTPLAGGESIEGGKWVDVECPIETIPVFVRW